MKPPPLPVDDPNCHITFRILHLVVCRPIPDLEIRRITRRPIHQHVPVRYAVASLIVSILLQQAMKPHRSIYAFA
jgi:hypothetical protein